MVKEAESGWWTCWRILQPKQSRQFSMKPHPGTGEQEPPPSVAWHCSHDCRGSLHMGSICHTPGLTSSAARQRKSCSPAIDSMPGAWEHTWCKHAPIPYAHILIISTDSQLIGICLHRVFMSLYKRKSLSSHHPACVRKQAPVRASYINCSQCNSERYMYCELPEQSCLVYGEAFDFASSALNMPAHTDQHIGAVLMALGIKAACSQSQCQPV